MRAQFVRGQDPKDAMEIGDVHGRKLKSIGKLLTRDFIKIFENKKYFKPEVYVEYREANVGFGNRNQLETDHIIISTEYKGYYFALSWLGNPLNLEVTQKFWAKWAKLPQPGLEDSKKFDISNEAILQLSNWIDGV